MKVKVHSDWVKDNDLRKNENFQNPEQIPKSLPSKSGNWVTGNYVYEHSTSKKILMGHDSDADLRILCLFIVSDRQ